MVEYNTQCSYRFISEPLTMAAAEVECVRAGGHLASIHSDEDNNAVTMSLGGSGAWIGFHDRFMEAGGTDPASGFVWTSGAAMDYTRWGVGEPTPPEELPCTGDCYELRCGRQGNCGEASYCAVAEETHEVSCCADTAIAGFQKTVVRALAIR